MSRLSFRRAHRPIACRKVAKRLQQYLDREVDDITAQRIARHLEGCRRCGLEHEVYSAIKRSVAESGTIDPVSVERLRTFGEQLRERGDATDPP